MILKLNGFTIPNIENIISIGSRLYDLFGKVYPQVNAQNRAKISNEALIESYLNTIKLRSMTKSELINQIDYIWDIPAEYPCSK